MWYLVGVLAVHFFLLLFLEARWMRRKPGPVESRDLPGVTVIRPVKGVDYGAEASHRTVFQQDYPRFEIIFSLQDPDDPALPLLRRLIEEHPGVDAKVIVNPLIDGVSGKVSNMIHGCRAAKYDTLVFCDADVPWYDRDTLKKLVAPLEDPHVGATTLMPVGIDSKGFWGKVMHLFTVTFGFQSLTLVVTNPRPRSGLVGGTFATRADVLETIGGLERFGAYAAEDLAMGRAMGEAGYWVRWMPEMLLPIGPFTYRDFYRTVKRWTLAGGKTFGLLWFIGYLGTYGYFWGILAGLTVAPGILAPMLTLAVLRPLGNALIALLVFPRSRAAALALFTPFVDALTAILTPLFWLHPVINWRGVRYRVGRNAVMERID